MEHFFFLLTEDEINKTKRDEPSEGEKHLATPKVQVEKVLCEEEMQPISSAS
jgi:hypothetical protein